jgi:MFS family permease
LVPTIILFGCSGLAIVFVTNFYQVLLLRAIQGVGVAGMMNLGTALIGDLFHEGERAAAMGYRTSAQNFTNAFIPFIGEALAAIVWFYPFSIYSFAIPLGIIAAFKLKVPPVDKSLRNSK